MRPTLPLAACLLLLLSGCGSDALPASDAQVAPDTPAVDAPVAADAPAPPEVDAGAGTDGGAPAGACTNAADLAILAPNSGVDIDAELPICVRALLLGGIGPDSSEFAGRVGTCLADATGLTPACGACYGENGGCSAKSCLMLCLTTPDSPDCSDCRCGRTGPTNCIAAFVACSGIPDDTCD